MKTIKLEIELTYDPDMWYGKDRESKKFFIEDVLGGPLLLFSQEIGDDIGPVKILQLPKLNEPKEGA